MKFTLSWLKAHLETGASLAELTERLTMLGLELESVEDRAAKLKPFVVGYVVEARPHPDADRLRVCVVDTGRDRVQVVCGAPNARSGMKGVFAPVGTVIPGTGLELKSGVIRGQASNGMLCSAREMGLGDDHEGIIELADDAPVGQPFAPLFGLDDPVIDVAITPNRPDCLGVRGIARDLAAAGVGRLKPRVIESVPGRFASPVGVRLDFAPEAASACPYFVGRYIRGVSNGPSPKWLQDRLLAVGLRPISRLVDITNFFTLDMSRPLHVFDADTLAGSITVRLARAGERVLALNGKEYELVGSETVIADEDGALALGGVVGGESSGCSDKTANVFVEAALFDPIRTAATGRMHQIPSDARYRFERGLDVAAVVEGMEAATQMIVDLCGGEASQLVIAGEAPEWRRRYTLRPDRVHSLGGVDVPREESKRVLVALGFEVHDEDDGALAVTPPSWRGDVEGEADLVEEVTRVWGYDRIPAIPLVREGTLPIAALTPSQRRVRDAKRALAGGALLEAVTFSFMSSAHARLFGADNPALRLANPISAELDVMRPSVLPNLILAAQRNADRGYPDSAVFEVGPIFRDDTPSGQSMVATGLRAGQSGPRHWAAAPRSVDAFDAKGDVFGLLSALGLAVDNLQITADAPSWYHPGRSGMVRLGPKTVLAQFGELHPGVLRELDAKGPMAGFEIFLDLLPAPRSKGSRARPLLKPSPFQPVERDFAFVLDAGVPAEQLVRAAKSVDRNLITAVGVFDVYQGKGVPAGKKSLAITVRLQPTTRTLTDAEIDAVGQRIVAAVAKATGATLRT